MAVPNYKYRLRKNYTAILRDLEPKKVVNVLYEKDVFDADDMEEVKCEKTRKKQAEVLLQKVDNLGDYEVAIFVNSLQQIQRHLYDLLQREVEMIQSQNQVNAVNMGYLTSALTSLQVHREPATYSPKALSPTAIEHPAQIGNTEKGAVFSQSSDPPPEDEIAPFVVPTDPSKLPSHITPESDLVYPMRSKPRGIALIINNEFFNRSTESTKREQEQEKLDVRSGSNEDVKALEKLFGALDFKVKTERNKGRVEMSKILEDAAFDDHSNYDCFVLWLMSHGQDGQFYGADGETISIETVRDFFSSTNCSTLKGKPKIIFIQACRGNQKGKGVVADAPQSPTEQGQEPTTYDSEDHSDRGFNFNLSKVIAEHADILIANSTISGYASFRNPRHGSRFVRCVVEVFQEFAGHEDLLSMLTMVNQRISEMGEYDTKQVSEPSSTLTKKLFFWPGL